MSTPMYPAGRMLAGVFQATRIAISSPAARAFLRGNIVTLIDVVSLKPFETYRYAAFGEERRYDSTGAPTDSCNPWRFASKRADPETRLFKDERKNIYEK